MRRIALFLSLFIVAFFALITFSTRALASEPIQQNPKPEIFPTNYCELTQQVRSFKSLAYDKLNLMAFANDGGLFNQGTCWWHSRLQQAAIYLARFQPSKPKPTYEEASRLISLLMTIRVVVEFPGYSNWYEFSRDWHQLIQKKLNAWQLREGIFGFAWIDGISGASQLPTAKLREKIQAFKDETDIFGIIAFAKLQLPGISAHSLLVVAVNPIRNGFEIEVIDSNYPMQIRKTYFVDSMMTYEGGVPYLERRKDFFSITTAMERYCGHRAGQRDWLDLVPQLSEDVLDQLIFEDLRQHYEEAGYQNR